MKTKNSKLKIILGQASCLLCAVAMNGFAGTQVIPGNEIVSGTNTAGYFVGNGSGLTNLTATNIVGTIPNSILSTNVPLLTNQIIGSIVHWNGSSWVASQNLTWSNQVLTVLSNGIAVATIDTNGNVFATGNLTVNGNIGIASGSHDVNTFGSANSGAANGLAAISSGTGIKDGGLVYLGIGQTRALLRNDTIIGWVTSDPISNGSQSVNAYFTNTSPGNILAYTNFAVAGTLTGNGGGLTNLTATNLVGTVPLGNLDTSVLTNADTRVWTNNNNILLNGLGVVNRTGPITGNDLASYNSANTLKDSGISVLNPLFSNNGGGLTNLTATNIVGGLTTTLTIGTTNWFFTNGVLMAHSP